MLTEDDDQRDDHDAQFMTLRRKAKELIDDLPVGVRIERDEEVGLVIVDPLLDIPLVFINNEELGQMCAQLLGQGPV